MKILVDTSYILPAVGIDVEGIPADSLMSLRDSGHEIAVSTVSFLEAAALSGRYIDRKTLSRSRANRGIRALMHDPGLEPMGFASPRILEAALAVREKHRDFLDCVILATAAAGAQALATEDRRLRQLSRTDWFRQTVRPESATFEADRLGSLIRRR